MTPLTKEQAIVISAYTGFALCNCSDVRRDIERRLGRPMRPIEGKSIEKLYHADFFALCHVDTPKEK